MEGEGIDWRREERTEGCGMGVWKGLEARRPYERNALAAMHRRVGKRGKE